MRRLESELFAPYKQVGVVCGDVPPVLRILQTQRRTYSLLCAVDNVVIHYRADKLRTIAVSDALDHPITALAATSRFVFAASGHDIALLPFCRQATRRISLGARARHLLVFGNVLVAVDDANSIHVVDIESGERQLKLEWPADAFEVTALLHPATYLNKILLGSSDGRLRLVNIQSGKLIYEFPATEKTPSKVTVLEQSPALDIVAVGHESGLIEMKQLKTAETVFTLRHEAAITALGFRTDEQPFLTSADSTGVLAVWHLEKRALLGKISSVHSGPVHLLQFIPGEAIMLSASLDNSLRVWVLDQPDDMPRQLVIMEGHSQPLTALLFSAKNEVIASGLDESVRKYSVVSDTLRQKLGSAGVMSRAKAKRSGRDLGTIRLPPVVEMAFGWSREAAWDNVLCRHEGELAVTTWTTRKQAQGTHLLLHDRFKKDSALAHHSATAIALSPCGNYAYIGYSTGDLDQFNVQSGRHLRTFSRDKKDKKATAHQSEVTALASDATGREIVSGDSDGWLRFWSTATGTLLAGMRAPREGKVVRGAACPVNALLAVVLQRNLEETDSSESSVALVDTLCRRVVRSIPPVAGVVAAVAFTTDGRWLLVADSTAHIRVWDIASTELIDVLLFSSPCVAMAFNTTGEHLVTCHKEERGMYVWASKNHFVAPVAPKPLPIDYLPKWKGLSDEEGSPCSTCTDLNMDDSMDAEESSEEENAKDEKDTVADSGKGLISLSGLPPARWANLPNLSLIKERNKPMQPPTKPKRAPFFLSAAPTLDGFSFEKEQDDTEERRRIQKAKRNLLELESAFSKQLKTAESDEEFLEVFGLLKKMSVSAIDFQLRTLSPDAMLPMLRMLLSALRCHHDFDLVQAYLATLVKMHRSVLWSASEGDEEEAAVAAVLQEIAAAQRDAWSDLSQLFAENLAILEFAKTAIV